MSKPIGMETPMFKLIEKQLVDAIDRDGSANCGGGCGNTIDALGPQARAVLAEILGYTHGASEPLMRASCDLPPEGWYCTRDKGHDGPCAAHPCTVDASGWNPMSQRTSSAQELHDAINRPGGMIYVTPELDQLREEVARLRGIINTPESDDFIKGVSIEAEFQASTHAYRDDGKTPADWAATVSFLLAKALIAVVTGDMAKAKHHLVTTAACCARWHFYLSAKS